MIRRIAESINREQFLAAHAVSNPDIQSKPDFELILRRAMVLQDVQAISAIPIVVTNKGLFV